MAAQPALRMAGMEGYEGVVHGTDPVPAIRDYAAQLIACAQRLDQDGLLAVEAPIITASGSAWYDLIAEAFDAAELRGRFVPVLRPGCYVVHDHGLYREAQRGVLTRRPDLHEGCCQLWRYLHRCSRCPSRGWRSSRWASVISASISYPSRCVDTVKGATPKTC
ncbi:type III PLP-dependent enzyme domain-containing protein [Modicisalibacter luteus]|uniref:hypothetical protein n=1 Tax=Modicisalibacter luteus TaxID=453962 RepID=UPI0036316A15